MEQLRKYMPGSIDIPIGNMLLTIYDRGWERNINPVEYNAIQFSSHFHALFEFQYAIENQVKLKTQNHMYTADSGEYLLIPPNCYHHTCYTEGKFERYSFLFSILMKENDAKGFSEFDYYFNIFSQIKEIVVHKNSVISDCIRRIMELEKEQKDIHVRIHKIKILFSMLFLAFTEDINQNQSGYTGRYPRISPEKIKLQNDINTFVSLHYNSSTFLQDLEKEFHMSSRHINRIFHELFGMSVSVVVLDIRMHSAWKYIMESDFTLEKIADLIGYHSYNTFYRAFRKYYGFSPEIPRKQK